MKNVYLYSAKRTPIGSFMGELSSLKAPELGAIAAKAALDDAKLDFEAFDESIMGCVLQAGLGQAPARQVSVFAGLPKKVRALTINKVCGSGLKAVSLAFDRIRLQQADLVLAGGMESMSNTPFYQTQLRTGHKMGNAQLIDGLVHDGLWDVYNQFHMGRAAELCAREFKFSREEQDAFAKTSYEKAIAATSSGAFQKEMTPVEIKDRKATRTIEQDEEPKRVQFDKMSQLKPAFDSEGSITAANASSINDGAAALVVGSENFASQSKALARVIHAAEFAQEPEWFTTAPVGSIQKLLKEASLKVSDIALFEINEAFSVVAMAAQKELGISNERLNPKGGAVALGHPIGASGARLLTTLVHSLEPKQKGVVSLCIGGGEAISMLIERL
ncbi:MAG: thiolase family protein [Bdellovibrionota bacterium]